MTSREKLWHEFVDAYDIDVPEEAVENELAYITLQMRHNIQYDRLTGGSAHLFPERELAEQEEELRALARFEAKEPRVLKAIIANQGLTATPEELASEAEAVARRQNATMDMVKRFFGDDFAGLEQDVLKEKAINWAVSRQE